MKHIDIERLVTVRHRAEQEGVVPETIRSRIRKGKMDFVSIDGVMFVETIQEKDINTDKKRKRNEDKH